MTNMQKLFSHRDLLRMWTMRELKVRYKQSLLGALWAVLQPLSLTVVTTIAFSYIARIPTGEIPYPVFVYSALLPWTLAATAITFSSTSLVNNVQLVTKVYFPREILPFGTIGAALIDFLFGGAVFVGLLYFFGFGVNAAFVWLPLVVAVELALIGGIGLIMAGVNVFYRDIRFVVPLALQVWMFLSPIVYPVELVPENLRSVYMLNPMAGIILSFRRVVLIGEAPVAAELFPAMTISLVLFAAGYVFFKRVEPQFADVI